MLSYELFLKNQKGNGEYPKRIVPIKKVYVKANPATTIELDPKTLDEYGGTDKRDLVFREPLSLPLNYLESVGLPYRNTGSASKKPYVEFYTTYQNSKLKINVQGEKKSSYEYSFDFEKNQEKQKATGATPLVLRLADSKYLVDNTTLHETYKKEGIINPNNEFTQDLFVSVCRAVVAFLKEKKIKEIKPNSKATFRFVIIVLPHSLLSENLTIRYHSGQKASLASNPKFKDSFGTTAETYASKTTINAKFMSFDDQAFTINCCTGEEFYKNLGIGEESFSKINLPTESGFRISGLTWYFFDIADPTVKFEAANSGIYDQLLTNYQRLKQNATTPTRASAMKIICAREAQAKLEILVDENLTFDRLEEVFNVNECGFQRHPMVIESLIVQRTNGPLWTDYLTGIRSFVYGTSIERQVILRRYLNNLRDTYLWDWINGKEKRKGDKQAFFANSEYCLKLLTVEGKKGENMNKNEEYAYKIGQIAGKYIQFKKKSDEANNSTSDILTYSKYDREKLRHVYSRVCIGISLSKTNKTAVDGTSKYIKETTPAEEIDDLKANEDYSYFFYKGVFENSK